MFLHIESTSTILLSLQTMSLCEVAEMEMTLQELLISSRTSQLLDVPSTAEQHGIAVAEKLASNGNGKSGQPQLGNTDIYKTVMPDLTEENYEKVIRAFFLEHLNNEGLFDSCVVDTILADGPVLRHWEVIIIGVSCLQLFVEINWTGKVGGNLLNAVGKNQTSLRVCTSDWLVDAVNGESVESVAKDPELLALAILCLFKKGNIRNVWENSWVVKWWQLRCLCVHQQVLTERTDKIYEEAIELITWLEGHMEVKGTPWHPFAVKGESEENIPKKLLFSNDEEKRKLFQVYLNLEIVSFYAHYFDVTSMIKVQQMCNQKLRIS